VDYTLSGEDNAELRWQWDEEPQSETSPGCAMDKDSQSIAAYDARFVRYVGQQLDIVLHSTNLRRLLRMQWHKDANITSEGIYAYSWSIIGTSVKNTLYFDSVIWLCKAHAEPAEPRGTYHTPFETSSVFYPLPCIYSYTVTYTIGEYVGCEIVAAALCSARFRRFRVAVLMRKYAITPLKFVVFFFTDQRGSVNSFRWSTLLTGGVHINDITINVASLGTLRPRRKPSWATKRT